MRCIEVPEPGGPEAMRLSERPVPEAGPGEIVIQVAFAGVNRPDALQRAGAYPPPPGASDLLGLEASGVVTAIGPGAERWQTGDRVTALLPGGGYAEYVTTRWDHALPAPPNLSLAEAAAIPETFFTVWTNVFQRAWLQSGEVLLVHGGASGIGTTAIQLGRVFGARVLTTAGSPEKCERCEKLGAERAINYRTEDFVEVVKEVTEKHGADVILDMVGGEYVARNIRAAAVEGRIANIAFLQGSKVTVDLMPAMLKRLTWRGSTLRARPDEEKATIAAELESRVWPYVIEGKVAPVMDSTVPLADAAVAHTRMEQSEHFGKIVLEVGGEDV